MSVRIVDVCEVTKPIASPIRNAYIDFTKMTTSLVAVVTDVKRDGKRVVGYGFNSNGRYGQGGLIRERFAPRLMEADPKSLLERSRRQSRPGQDLGRDDVEREAGRPRRALGRGRHHRHGGVGCGGEDRRQAAVPLAGRAPQAQRPIRASSSMPPAATTIPARTSSMLRDEMRGYLDRGYTVVKMKIGGAPIAEDRERIEAVLKEIGKDGAARRRRQRPLRSGDRDRLCQDAARLPAVLVRGGRRSARLRAAGRARRVLSRADGDRRESVLPSGRAQPDPLRRHAPRPRLAAIRLRAVLRPLRISAHARRCCTRMAGRRAAASRMAATRCRSTSRPASASAATRAIRTCSSPMAAFPTACVSRMATSPCRTLPGIGFEGKSDLYAEMKALAA